MVSDERFSGTSESTSSRRLSETEIEDLLSLPVELHLGTIAPDGFPHVTPLWFIYENGVIYMTSKEETRHVNHLRGDNRAAISIAIDGVDPLQDEHWRVQMRGNVELTQDIGGVLTERITRKYTSGPKGERLARARAQKPQAILTFRPIPGRVSAFGSPITRGR